MRATRRRPGLWAIAALSLALAACPGPRPAAPPRNVILFIGDGMGLEHVRAGGLYANGAEGTLAFETFPSSSLVRTGSLDSDVTDSAAAATAMATGHKVPNGVISTEGGEPLPTILEQERDEGKSTGLVTTAYVTHATPAAFAAHADSRTQEELIAAALFAPTGPTLILGGGGAAHGISPARAEAAGYVVVTSRGELQGLEPAQGLRVSGQFGEGHLPYELDGLGDLPDLEEMTEAALSVLSLDPDGFFLMVEGARIDHASYENELARMLGEIIAFDDTVAWTRLWGEGRGDTMIVVTADHETGGLTVSSGNGASELPQASWSTTGHTGVPVGIWALGPWSDSLGPFDEIDNTDVYRLMRGELAPPAPSGLIRPRTVDTAAAAGRD